MPEKPKTMALMVEALWYTVIGTNGHGLTKRVDDLIEKLEAHLKAADELVPKLWTRDEHETFVQLQAKKRRSKWLAVKDVILLGIGIGGFLLAVVKAFH